jgi:putative transposase
MSHACQAPIYLSVVSVSVLTGIAVRTVQDHCAKKKFKLKTSIGNGGAQSFIDLVSLPDEAQAKYWIQQYHDTFLHDTPRQQRFDWFMALNLDPEGGVFSPVYKAAGLHIDPMAWTDEESEQHHEKLFNLKTFAKETARERAQLVRGFVAAKRRAPEGLETQAGKDFAEIEGKSYATLARWHKLVKHLELKDWEPALTPGWKGGRKKVDFHPEVWDYITCQYMVESRPNAKYVYQRACAMAQKKGLEVPSYRIALARLNATDRGAKTLMREGKTAFNNMFPSIKRDYSTVGLNEIWCSDGRKADIFCVWPDGHVGRPIVVGWIDVRSRFMLGWHVGKVESAEEVRLSFRNAVQCKNALPNEAYIDNGRGYASKTMTGGQATRNRFKVKVNEITGILTLTGVNAIWATPGHGQAKPIESFWNRISGGTDRRAEFVKAYCGNRPENRPEGSKPEAHPVPLAEYMAAFKEDIDAYNLRSHRGDSMDGKSPTQIYAELQETTISRAPTQEQMQWCMLAAKPVTLNRKNFSLTINGSSYWHADLTTLDSTGPYTARYDADDSTAPVQLFDGEKFICNAALMGTPEFRSQTACKDYARADKVAKRAVKDIEKSIKDKQKARKLSVETPLEASGAGDLAGVSAPKVVTPMRATKNYKPIKPEPLSGVEVNRWLTPEMEANRERKIAAMGGRY